jgi:hypothetical protein
VGSRILEVAAPARRSPALQDDATPAWTGRELLAIALDGTLLRFVP